MPSLRQSSIIARSNPFGSEMKRLYFDIRIQCHVGTVLEDRAWLDIVLGDGTVRRQFQIEDSATGAAWHRGIIKHHNIDTQDSRVSAGALNIRRGGPPRN